MTTYTTPLTSAQAKTLRQTLQRGGFKFVPVDHTLFAARKGTLNVTVYLKGPKVLVQGRDTEDFVRLTLEPKVLGEARLGHEKILQPDMFTPHFGIDESGKGDYFGPLVIAGVFTNAAVARALLEAGVIDSKRVTSPARIRELARRIRATRGVRVELLAINPPRYNTLYQSLGNVNLLLASGHAKVIAKLAAALPSCRRTLSDRFANRELLARTLHRQGLTLTLEQRSKAETDVAVAAASIIACEHFIDWIDQASAKYGIPLPRSAGDAAVDAARTLVAKMGPDALGKVAKLHFRTSARVSGDLAPDAPRAQ